MFQNVLLEQIYLGNVSDVGPWNEFVEIDLSHNPNIRIIEASLIENLQRINLKNGGNNENISINVSMWEGWTMPDPNMIANTVCIEVDNPELAQDNQFPYSEWEIEDLEAAYYFTESCEMGTNNYNQQSVKVYPNPASDVLYFTVPVERAHLIDMSGRVVREYNDVSATAISLSGIEKGMYLVRLTTGNATQTEKIVVQ